MSKKKPTKSEGLNNEYNIVISNLRHLTMRELLDLYVIAKTGSERDLDNIPVHYFEAIDELGIIIDAFMVDSILNDLFNKDAD
jgi:tRNA U34 5-carboxymethylaminomethyl modifying GTPase MnmE/TrmE